MNTLRMFVFAVAVLSTAFLLRVIAAALCPEQPIPTAKAAHGAAVLARPQPAADRYSP